PGGAGGAKVSATIVIADPNNIFTNTQYFSGGTTGGGGGTGGGTTQNLATCLTVNQHNNIKPCLTGTATFTDTAHISYQNYSFVASSWGGNDIYYTIESDPTLTNLGAKFDIKTDHTATDLNIDDPSSINDLQDLRRALAGNYTTGIEFDILDNSGTVQVKA